MKKLTFSSKFLLPILGLSLLFTFSLCNAPDTTSEAEETSVSTPPLGSAAPPSTMVSNDDGRPRPNPSTFNSNEAFHHVAWEYFKWLTDTVDVATGKLRFETLYNADEIGDDMEKDRGLFLTQSIKDKRADIMGGIRQADSDGILVDENGHAVYTSMHIDQNYHDFIQEHKLYDPVALRAVDDTLNFPDWAFSLKVAWKIVEDDEDASKFYVTEADVARMAYNSKKKIILTDETDRRKVAMVGFHIALVVPGHPEMVWITFEHNKNAPDFVPNTPLSDPVSTENFTFYRAGKKMNECNNHPPLTLDEEHQKLSPVTDVFRRYAYGNAAKNMDIKTDTAVHRNNSNIDNLNQVNHDSMAIASIWRNYDEIGAIWFNKKDKLEPNRSFVSTDPLLTGSLLLSNSVIETFTQNSTGRNQCFGCHNTEAVLTGDDATMLDGKNVLTSHILVKNYLKRVIK